MSYDLTLPTVCDHRLYRERVLLESDRKTIRLLKPLANAGSMDVWASDNKVDKTQYLVVFDPTSVTINQLRMVQFKFKWKNTEDYFEIVYNTIKGFCPKCVGLGNLDDISYDVRGHLAQSHNEKLLLQNLEKFTITELGSNPFHLFTGTPLKKLIGTRVLDMEYLRSRIIQGISSSLNTFKDMQQQYIRTTRPVTTGEILGSIQRVIVNQDTNDPSIIRVEVFVTSASGQPINYTQYLRTAGAY